MTQPATHATTPASSPIHQAMHAHQEARDLARRYRKAAAKLLARVERAAAAGDHEGAAYLRGTYIDSVCARYVAAETQNNTLPKDDRYTTLDLIAMVKRLNARHGTDEPVRVSFKDKKSGGVRPICHPGFKNRVLEQLVLTALAAGSVFHPAQFNVPGHGGMIAATKAIHDAYASGLYKYVVQVDVRNCYPSLTATGVAENLPIPRQVTNAVVMMDNLHLTLSDTTAHARHHRSRATPSALTGLPQGSVCSAIVQSILLKPLLDIIPASAFAAMWGDNLITLFRTKAEAERTLLDLHQAARLLPSGPLRLTDGGVGRVLDKEEFIGSVFQRRKGRPLTMPSASAKNNYTNGIKEILALPPSRDRSKAYHSLRRSFMSSHRLWPDVENWTALRKIAVEARMRPDFAPNFARMERARRYFFSHR